MFTLLTLLTLYFINNGEVDANGLEINVVLPIVTGFPMFIVYFLVFSFLWVSISKVLYRKRTALLAKLFNKSFLTNKSELKIRNEIINLKINDKTQALLSEINLEIYDEGEDAVLRELIVKIIEGELNSTNVLSIDKYINIFNSKYESQNIYSLTIDNQINFLDILLNKISEEDFNAKKSVLAKNLCSMSEDYSLKNKIIDRIERKEEELSKEDLVRERLLKLESKNNKTGILIGKTKVKTI